MIRMLPEGIGVIPLFLDVRKGSHKEFEDAIHVYESYIEQLMEQEVDLVCPEGGGPFILVGHKGELALTNKWRKKYGVPMVTSSLSQVNSMRALGMKRPCIASYATGVKDEERDAYYRAAGFNVAGQAVVPLDDFEKAGQLSVQEVYAEIKKRFLEMPKADGILIRGSGWRSLEAIELLEQDLGVPVSHAVTARVWEVQKRLRVHQPVKGFGRLMSELPGNVPE
jgi:maleate isomerase